MPSNDGGEKSDASQRTDWDPEDANGARKREEASAESGSNFLGWPNERFEAHKRAFHARFDAALAAQREERSKERSDSKNNNDR